MGRIKSTMIKRASRQILANGSGDFNKEFENNKKQIRGLLPSKPMQNRIAGYIAHLKRMDSERAEKEAKRAKRDAERAVEEAQAVQFA